MTSATIVDKIVFKVTVVGFGLWVQVKNSTETEVRKWEEKARLLMSSAFIILTHDCAL